MQEYNHTEQQEWEEWINDPAAQLEYKRWKLITELKNAGLPDPFSPNFTNEVRNLLRTEP